ncbi:MAG: Ig-like domain-containing protein [Clostridia bacterium]|nr:Ig-like domain-containing protein [Clostridia bacterium]
MQKIKKIIGLFVSVTFFLSSFSGCLGLPQQSYSGAPVDSSSIFSDFSDSSLEEGYSDSSIEDSSSDSLSDSSAEDSSSDSSSDSSVEDSSSSSSDDSTEEDLTEYQGTHYNVVSVAYYPGMQNGIAFRFSDVEKATVGHIDLGYAGWTPADGATNAFKEYITLNGGPLPSSAYLQGMDKKDALALSGLGTLTAGTTISIPQGVTFTHGDITMTTSYTFTWTWNGTEFTMSKTFGNGVALMQSQYDVGVDATTSLSTQTQGVTGVTYTSSNPNIATVDANGNVLGKKEGSVKITVSATVTGTGKKMETTCKLTVQPKSYASLDGSENCVRWLGRTFTANNTVVCDDASTGFAVRFYGTKLTASIKSVGAIYNITTNDRVLPILTVLLDGSTNPMERLVPLNKTGTTASEYVLVQGLAMGWHTAYVQKTSQANQSSIAVCGISTDGYLGTKPYARPVKLEVYGDSITAGSNTLKADGADVSETGDINTVHNCCMTYAFLASLQLNAELNVHARSAVGLYSNINNVKMPDGTTIVSMLQLWDDYYAWESETDFLGNAKPTQAWNFNSYIPDAVIVNLATNDAWNDSYVPGSWNTTTYKNAMITFCDNLFSVYGSNLKIVLISGLMDARPTPVLEEVVAHYTNGNVTHLQRPSAVMHHPSKTDHEATATALKDHLYNVLRLYNL